MDMFPLSSLDQNGHVYASVPGQSEHVYTFVFWLEWVCLHCLLLLLLFVVAVVFVLFCFGGGFVCLLFFFFFGGG